MAAMKQFLAAAGVVGFPGSINGIISICEKAVSLLERVRETQDLGTERARVGNICGAYLRLKEKQDQEKDEMDRTDLQLLMLSTAVVQEKMTEVLLILEQPVVMISDKKSINEKLDECDRVVGSYVTLVCLDRETRPATEVDSAVANLLKENKLLQRLMDRGNSRAIPKSTLREQNWYITDTTVLQVMKPDSNNNNSNNAGSSRCVVVEGKTYMVERIALGKTRKETELRLSRLGKLLMIMRDDDDAAALQGHLLLMSKIVEERDHFCILSELEDPRYRMLEEMLPTLGGDQALQVVLRTAEAVQSLHKMSLVHEGLNSHNILVHPDSMKIKLTGFASSRECLDLSDCLTPEDPDMEKRNKIFQAPEKLAGSRYSFECDVYSLGMVMAEVYIGRPLVHETIMDRDGLMDLLKQRSPVFEPNSGSQVAALIQDIVQAEKASHRPLALEISERLSRIDGSR